MNREKPIWWPLHLRGSRHSQEPSEALFQGLRVRLTLWYCAVLASALVLFGVALYFSTQYFLLSPIESDAQQEAQHHAGLWLLDGRPEHACRFPGPGGQPVQPSRGGPSGQRFFAIVCFGQNGSLLPGEDTTGLQSAFLTTAVVQSALHSPTRDASDTVQLGGSIGLTYRYALVVSNSAENGNVGVVVVGESIQAQEAALSVLLPLLLGIGGIALLGMGLGGLFLANRALAPARLAFTRQQRFIADASHELRTPLTLMRADAEVLLRGREGMAEEDAALLEDIVAEANHMSTLANSMLTLARLDDGSQHREHEVVTLSELALRGVQRVAAFAEQKGVAVHQECTDAAFVIGDPMLLEQAVLVLLDNAIKYNRPGGQVTVYTSISDGKARLEVRDTGIGIAPEHLPHLGERFYRVDKARSREAGGTGLGLSIAQRIASVHGGTLTLTSIPNQGTTVTLLLPLVHSTPSEPVDDAPGRVPSLPERS